MIMPLHHDEGVACGILGGDVPGLLGAARAAADVKPGALAEGVEGQSLVRAEPLAVERFDRARASARR